jgi:hypothetical protein
MGKAATLVMLQPSAPARESTAWMHAPSQPLMRSVSIRLIGTPAQPPSSVDNKALTWHSIYAYGNQVVTANGLAQGETGAKACTQAGCHVHAQAAA